jgi:hypothetical protein
MHPGMKQRLTNYIIGYFFVLAFLLSGVIPDLLIVSGQLSNKAATETVAEQEAVPTPPPDACIAASLT